jgi:hypothetical protein
MTTDNFCFYFQNRLIQTSQTGLPLVFPALAYWSVSMKSTIYKTVTRQLVDQEPLLAHVLQDLLLHLEGDLRAEGVVLRELGVKV